MRRDTIPTTRARRTWRALARAIALAIGTLAGLGHAQSSMPVSAGVSSPVIYPAKDQSAKQQDQDKYQCHDWARGQSGFDPSQAPAPAAVSSAPAATAATSGSGGPSLSGMAKGAAGGAAVAELAHRDAGHGAAVGVVSSTVLGRLKERQTTQARQQQAQAQAHAQQQQQQAARGQQRAAYDRAFAACLEGRGYVVK